ncbi:nucleotidyl transferase AbiEii/AbiGii toxin family protein [Kribbella sp. NPDC048915]|uniref:nucleotidyl transferase AbiEii/AbiGii toxin family protein n=1 Tax=Kribbella sp. NPDC048915 TaxID=3155148 RepID=UPI0034110CB0
MKPEHERATRIALDALRDKGFALAGGNALTQHGIGSRPSDDIDLFTNQMNTDVGETLTDVRAAFAEQGYSTETIRQSEHHSRIEVARGAEKAQIDFGKDFRSKPPVESEVGPVISVEDAVGSKVGSIYTRGEAKDFVDVDAAMRAGYSTDHLLQLADAREASPIDRPMFAELLDNAQRIPDAEYAKYGLDAEQTAGLKERMGAWANQIRTREANPDIDRSVGLLNSGQAMPGQVQAAGSSETAGRSGHGLSQDRSRGERGS